MSFAKDGEPSRAGMDGARLVSFEAVRGLAALAVVFNHVIAAFWPGLIYREGALWQATPGWVQALSRFPGKFIWDGREAVTIFFVLSGFVLSIGYFRKGSVQTLGSGAVRRYPRLMLPIAGSILLTFVLMKCGAIRNGAAADHLHAVQGIVVDATTSPKESHLWLKGGYDFTPTLASAARESVWEAFVGLANYNLVLWTMPLEFTYSLMVFAFLALFGHMRNRWLLYLILSAFAIARDCDNGIGDGLWMLDFVLGMILCDLWTLNQRTWRWEMPLVPALIAVAVGVFLIRFRPASAVVILAAVAASPRLQRVLSTPTLAWIGKLSFSLYLVRMMILCSLGCETYLLLCRDLGWSNSASTLIAAAVTLPACFLGAWVFYRAFDRPAVAFTHWLDAWLFRPNPKPAASSSSSPSSPSSPSALSIAA